MVTRGCEVEKKKRHFIPLTHEEKRLTPREKTEAIGQVIEEAKRCLGTQVCGSCEMCSLLCPDLCITRDPGTGRVVIDYDYCKGCGICAFVCPKGAIAMVLEE
jgi:2-oxoacid:acceptor oxidoreductase delta subunit (pyruvate/2-ketoisovalerate family)